MSFTINDNPLKNLLAPFLERNSYGDDNDDSCDYGNGDNDENKRNLFHELKTFSKNFFMNTTIPLFSQAVI